MESLAVAAFPDGEWDYSFNKMFSNEEELDFTHQILHQFSFPSEHDQGLNFINSSIMCPTNVTPQGNSIAAGVNECMLYSSNFHPNNNSQESSSQSTSNSSGSVFVCPPNPDSTNYYLSGSNHVATVTNDVTMSLDISMDASFPPPIIFPNNIAMEDLSPGCSSLGGPAAGFALAAANELLLKRNLDVLELNANNEGDHNNIMMDGNSSDDHNTKKRPRVSKDHAPKVYKKRGRKMSAIANGNEGESCSTCSSEDDLVSQETSQALNLNGKARASRGSATDPQSLYARKRRERINERLRILQNLVPNGTKVDISTMLEEAVHYVKFLQLQIKLLSSDDLWMYAPIAYNGMDIGLTKKISTLL